MTSDAELSSHPVTERATPDPFVVWVSGDMDMEHAAGLRSSLLTSVGRAPRGADIILDLRNSSFCDSTGLNVLLAVRERAGESGHRLKLAAPSHQMVRLLEITDSIELFELCPAVPAQAGTTRP